MFRQASKDSPGIRTARLPDFAGLQAIMSPSSIIRATVLVDTLMYSAASFAVYTLPATGVITGRSSVACVSLMVVRVVGVGSVRTLSVGQLQRSNVQTVRQLSAFLDSYFALAF